jgi:hypothetical protein
MTNIKRDKRAYIAYMSELLLKQKADPETIIEDNSPIEDEILRVEKHISDLDFIISNNDTEY